MNQNDETSLGLSNADIKNKPLLILGVNGKQVFSSNQKLAQLLEDDQVKLLSLIKSNLVNNILNVEPICYFDDLQKEKYKIEIINGNLSNEPAEFINNEIQYPSINKIVLENLQETESINEVNQELINLDLSKDDIFHEELSNKQYLARLGELTITKYPVLSGYCFQVAVNEQINFELLDYQNSVLATFGTPTSTSLKDWIFSISVFAESANTLGKKYIDDTGYAANVKVASLTIPEVTDDTIDDILNESQLLAQKIKETKEGLLLNPQRSYFAIFKSFFLSGIQERCYELHSEFEAKLREI